MPFLTFAPTSEDTRTDREDYNMPDEPQLKISREELVHDLEERISAANEMLATAIANFDQAYDLRDGFTVWDDYNKAYLRRKFTSDAVSIEYTTLFASVGGTFRDIEFSIKHHVRSQRQKLESLRSRVEFFDLVDQTSAIQQQRSAIERGDGIFVVHGHDGDLKLQVARFVEQCVGVRPIVLHEKADRGRTIIEKFEEHASEARFAIVLLTADDEGRPTGTEPLSPRARQNVVLEHGFFIGQLGRENVVALYEKDVELPSDLSGLLYKSVEGNWHTELATELEAAKFKVNLNNLT
jgi:predicted nucleotide-binding protein